MAGKQAKTLSDVHVSALRDYCLKSRNPLRNQVVVLLSAKAGLRAGEIAKLTWEMLLTPTGQVGAAIELQNSIAKKGGGRLIPINPTLRKALEKLLKESSGTGPVILSSAVMDDGRASSIGLRSLTSSAQTAVHLTPVAGLCYPRADGPQGRRLPA